MALNGITSVGSADKRLAISCWLLAGHVRRPGTWLALVLTAGLLATPASAATGPLDRPAAGSHALRLLSPARAELSVYDEVPAGARPPRWDFVNDDGARAARA